MKKTIDKLYNKRLHLDETENIKTHLLKIWFTIIILPILLFKKH